MANAITAENLADFRISSLKDLRDLRQQIEAEKDPAKTEIVVCHGTGCMAAGSPKVTEAMRAALAEADLDIDVRPGIKTTGCHGFCSRGPLVIIQPEGIFYQKVKPEDCAEIIQTTIVEGLPVERLLYKHPQTGEQIVKVSDIPFYNLQKRVVLRNIGRIDPTDITDSIAAGSYQALAKALTEMSPEQVLEEVLKSGIRGRGGAGFPSGRKWKFAIDAAKESGESVYVACNGDEGDPGAFMDCMVMEGDPHAVLEGMILGAYAMGSCQGYIYVRAEYPVAIKHLSRAMEQARALGLLGDNIMGTGFSFDIQINRGAGAFVCGEETALMRSIEGKAGTPRPRPPFPAQKGLFGKPTVLNNVESWANIPQIVENGGEWFAEIGVDTCPGTKIFSLVGKVNNVGLVEVPMGVPIKYIVEEIGGGVPGGKKFKAVQTGGPSGGCIPYEFRDIPVEFDSLVKAGFMMGSGGMIVMDDRDCMVDVARYFLGFLEEESCGQCMPCRLGIPRLREMLDEISEGRGKEEYLDAIESLAMAVKDGSLCALGGSAPNPALTTLKYFRDEYLAHIRDHKCPAGVCKALITFSIDQDKCTGCGACARLCPQEAISGEKKKPHAVDQAACIRCGICFDTCKFDAVVIS